MSSTTIGLDPRGVHTSPQFGVGSFGADESNEYVYCQASAAISAAGQVVVIGNDNKAAELTTSNNTNGLRVGVANATVAANSYCWVAVRGPARFMVGGGATAGAALYATATGGVVDDAASGNPLAGIEAAANSGAMTALVDGRLTYPSIALSTGGGGGGGAADGVVSGGSVSGTTLTLTRTIGADITITGLPSGGGGGGGLTETVLYEETSDQTHAEDVWIDFTVSRDLADTDDGAILYFARKQRAANSWEVNSIPVALFRSFGHNTDTGTGVENSWAIKTLRDSANLNSWSHSGCWFARSSGTTWRWAMGHVMYDRIRVSIMG